MPIAAFCSPWLGGGCDLQLIERAGYNPHAERPAEVMRAIRDFISP